MVLEITKRLLSWSCHARLQLEGKDDPPLMQWGRRDAIVFFGDRRDGVACRRQKLISVLNHTTGDPQWLDEKAVLHDL